MAVSNAGISPGVYTKITDLSEYVRTVPSTIGFIAIVSDRGPDNQLVFTNARDFFIDFGEPNINYGGKRFAQGKYVASSFLTMSDSLYVLRVMPTDSQFSNLCIKGIDEEWGSSDSTGTVTAKSVVFSNETGLDALFTGIDPEDETADTCVVFYGVGRGAWYDNFKINITKHRNTIRQIEGIYILDIYQRLTEDAWNPDTNSFEPDYGLIHSFEVSFDPDKRDSDAESIFVEDVVNRYCRFINCRADKDICRQYNDAGFDWSMPFVSYSEGIALDNGDDGSIFDTDSDTNFATTLLAKAYDGTLPKIWNVSAIEGSYVDEVHDIENYYFNIIMDGGYDTEVKDKIVHLAKDLRQDCVAILDNEDNTTANDALTKRRDEHNYNDFHAAIYEPYTRIFDTWTGQYIWITPVYHLAKIIPYTDSVAELWNAPAGFNRAMVEGIEDFRFTPSQAYRDLFYLAQINPIVKFNVGNTVFGQLTSQKRPTALQDLNIVRLVLYVKRALEQFCRYYIFESNDQETWNAVQNQITKFLKVIHNKRGLYSYGVEVGATEYEIKSKQMHVNVTLTPVKVVERIYLNFTIK